jgi:hypothetical protein
MHHHTVLDLSNLYRGRERGEKRREDEEKKNGVGKARGRDRGRVYRKAAQLRLKIRGAEYFKTPNLNETKNLIICS